MTPEQLAQIAAQRDQNAALPQGAESPQLMAARSAAASPSFLKFLIEIMRQGSLNPNPPGFDMNTQGSGGGGITPATQLEQMHRRRGMLNS